MGKHDPKQPKITFGDRRSTQQGDPEQAMGEDKSPDVLGGDQGEDL